MNLLDNLFGHMCTGRCFIFWVFSLLKENVTSLVVAVCVVEEDDVRAPEHPGGDPEDLDPAVEGGVPPQLEVVPHHRHPHVRRHDLRVEKEAANLIYPGRNGQNIE